MRRSRLKILPSRCVATLGFTLLLLACPTIAEESVRPAGIGENESSATHAHARIKDVPPDGMEVCKIGEKVKDHINFRIQPEAAETSAAEFEEQQYSLENAHCLPEKNKARETMNKAVVNVKQIVDESSGGRARKGGKGNETKGLRLALERDIIKNHKDRAQERIAGGNLLGNSIGKIKSGNREISRRSEKDYTDEMRKNMRYSMADTTNGNRNRQIKRQERKDTVVTRSRQTVTSSRYLGREVLGFPEMEFRSITSSLYRRVRDTSQDSRGNGHDYKTGEVMSLGRRQSDHLEDFRGSEWAPVRNVLSKTRSDRISGNLVKRHSHKHTSGDRTTRRARSLPGVKSDIREISRQSDNDYADTNMRVSRYPETITAEVGNGRPVIQDVREEPVVIRRREVVTSERNLGRGVLSVRGMKFRSNSLSLHRRVRDLNQESRENARDSRTREVMSLGRKYTENPEDSRRTEGSPARNVPSKSRSDRTSEIRVRMNSREYTSGDRTTRRAGSFPGVRSDIREISRRSDNDYANTHMRATRRIATDPNDVINGGRANQDAREKPAVIRSREITTSVRNVGREVLSVHGVTDRSNSLSLHRRGLDLAQDSRGGARDSRTREVMCLGRKYTENAEDSRRTEGSPARNVPSKSRNDRTSEIRVRMNSREYTSGDRTTRRAGSFPRVRSDIREISRRSDNDYANIHMRATRRIATDPNDVINGGRANQDAREKPAVNRSREINTSVRNVGREVLSVHGVTDRSNSLSLHPRGLDLAQDSRGGARDSRTREVMSLGRKYTENPEDSRRTEGSPARNVPSKSRNDRTSEIRFRMNSREYTSGDKTTRRAGSFPRVRSDIREISRRSDNDYANTHMRATRRIATDPNDVINGGRANQDAREKPAVNRSREINTSVRNVGREVLSVHGVTDRSNSLSLHRRGLDLAQDSRGGARDSRTRKVMSLGRKYTENPEDSRRTEGSPARNVPSKSRNDRTSEIRVRMNSRKYTSGDKTTRRAGSFPRVRSDIWEISRRSDNDYANTHMRATRRIATDPNDVINGGRANQDAREKPAVIRSREIITSVRNVGREVLSVHGVTDRSNSLSLHRRGRDLPQDSRGGARDSRTREVMSLGRKYSENPEDSRRTEGSPARNVPSKSRSDRISEIRVRMNSREYTSGDRTTRRARSFPGVRSDIREISRRSDNDYANTHMRAARRIATDPNDVINGGRANQDAREKPAVIRSREIITSVRNVGREVLSVHGVTDRSNSLSLHRRGRDLPQDSRGGARDSRTREVMSLGRKYSENQEYSRRTEGSPARNVPSKSRSDRISEIRVRMNSREYTSGDRTTRRARSFPGVRSDIREISRRSDNDYANTHMRAARRIATDPNDVINGGRANQDAREKPAVIRSREIITSVRNVGREVLSVHGVTDRSNSLSLHRRGRDLPQDSRGGARDSRTREVMSLGRKYSENQEYSRRTEGSPARNVPSKSRSDRISEIRVRMNSREYTSGDRTTRRARSFPWVRSDIREISRRSDNDYANTHMRAARRIATDPNDVINGGRANQDAREKPAVIRSREIITSVRNVGREVLSVHGVTDRSNSLSLHRRGRDLPQDSRGGARDSRTREVMSLGRTYSENQEYSRRTEGSPARNVPSKSRSDRISEIRVRMNSREYTSGDRTTRRARSFPGVRSDIREISRRSDNDYANTHMRAARRIATDPNDVINGGRANQDAREKPAVIRSREIITSVRNVGREVLSVHGVTDRSNSLSLHRRGRDLPQDSRGGARDSRTREVMSLGRKYSENQEYSRRTEGSPARNVPSKSRSDRISEIRVRMNSREYTSGDRTTRRAGSFPGVRSDIREISRRSDKAYANTHMRATRRLATDPNDVINYGRAYLDVREESAVIRNRESVTSIKNLGSEALNVRRMNYRSNPLTLHRRRRNLSQDFTGGAHDSRTREVMSFGRKYAENPEDCRRTEGSPARNVPSKSGCDRLTEDLVKRHFHEYTSGDRTTRRAKSLPGVRSDIWEISRRSDKVLVASRMMTSSFRLVESSSPTISLFDRHTDGEHRKLSTKLSRSTSLSIVRSRSNIYLRSAVVDRRVGNYGKLFSSNIPSAVRNIKYVPSHFDSQLMDFKMSYYLSNVLKLSQATKSFVYHFMVGPDLIKCMRAVEYPLSNSTGNVESMPGNHEMTPEIQKYSLLEDLNLFVPTVISTPENGAVSFLLQDWKFPATMFPNIFSQTENIYDSLTLGVVAMEPSPKPVSSHWILFLPHLYSHGKKDFKDVSTTSNSVVFANVDGQEINENNNKRTVGCFLQGLNGENVMKILQPKTATTDNMFSLTIGACMAALMISVSTK